MCWSCSPLARSGPLPLASDQFGADAGGYGLRSVMRGQLTRGAVQSAAALNPDQLPSLDVVVAARDEEAVVPRLVERLTSLRYPSG